MLYSMLVSVSFGVILVTLWYAAFHRLDRIRARRVLSWLQDSISARGEITDIEWVGTSLLRARVQLPGCGFRHPALEARMAPRETPVRWLLWVWHSRRETLQFEADLVVPPLHTLEIGRTHYTGLTRRWARGLKDWPTHPLPSLFISTQPEWQPEISSRLSSVVSVRECNFLSVSFRTRPPHFTVTFALAETLAQRTDGPTIFDSLRLLAESSPTSRP
jgi:hypothetical protein